jgi:hypothetical protein
MVRIPWHFLLGRSVMPAGTRRCPSVLQEDRSTFRARVEDLAGDASPWPVHFTQFALPSSLYKDQSVL